MVLMDRPIHMDLATHGVRLAQPHSIATDVVAVAEGLRQKLAKRRPAYQPLSRPSSVHSVPKHSGLSTTGSDTKSRCTCLLSGGCVLLTAQKPSTLIPASYPVSFVARPIQTMPISKATTTLPAKSVPQQNGHSTERIILTSTCVWCIISSFRIGL